MSEAMSGHGGRWEAPASVRRLGMVGLVVGLAAATACVAGYAADPEQFFRSWLLGVVFAVGFPLGCLGLLMLQHLTGGDWGVISRRVLEAGAGTLPLLLLLFVPLLVWGLGDLYEWTHPEAIAGDHVLEHKAGYLEVGFFQLRTLFYFAVWIALAWVLCSLSVRQDRAPDPALTKRMQAISAAGVILYVLTATFASYDWLMSLAPHWYSTMYGVWFVGTHGLSALALVILTAVLLSRRGPLAGVLAPRHFHDWGKLLFAFVVLWAYFSISQFLIIWSGNLPEEIRWYLPRFQGGWLALAGGLFVFHFGVPFLLLLSRDLKRTGKGLAAVAAWMILVRWADLVWQIVPTFRPEALSLSWMDVAAPLAAGGLWLAFFSWRLARKPLVPVGDPYLEEAMVHGH